MPKRALHERTKWDCEKKQAPFLTQHSRYFRACVVPTPTEISPLAKQQKTSAELEDLVHQKLLIGDVYASVRPDPILGWRATVIIAPKPAKAIQERAETVAAELRKKFTLQT